MKKVLIILLFLLSFTKVFGQQNAYVRGDSIILTNKTKSAIIVLQNATKDTTGGFAKNVGHGVIHFVKINISDVKGLSDSLGKKLYFSDNFKYVDTVIDLNDTLKAAKRIILSTSTTQPALVVDGANVTTLNPTLQEWKYNGGPRIAAITILGGLYGNGVFANAGSSQAAVNTSVTGTHVWRYDPGGVLMDWGDSTTVYSTFGRNGSITFHGITDTTGLDTSVVIRNGKLYKQLASGGGGTTTFPLTMNNSGTGASSGTTFDGSGAKTISYNTIGAAPAFTASGGGVQLSSGNLRLGGSLTASRSIDINNFNFTISGTDFGGVNGATIWGANNFGTNITNPGGDHYGINVSTAQAQINGSNGAGNTATVSASSNSAAVNFTNGSGNQGFNTGTSGMHFSSTIDANAAYYDGVYLLPTGNYIPSKRQVDSIARFVADSVAAGSGGITSVSGTTNRITSIGGTTPVIDISASYVGQTSITTLGTIATGSIPYSLITGAPAALTSSNFVFGEVPSGTVNSSNVTFTLANTPTSGTVRIFQNGLRDKITIDYTISGSTITFTTAPSTGDLLLIDYLK
jgi:hypothetical protein